MAIHWPRVLTSRRAQRPASRRAALAQRGNREREAGALADRALAVDGAVVLLDDAVGDRQPEPGALADGLGGEERIVDAGQVLGRMPAPVSDLDDRAPSLDRRGTVSQPPRHRVAGVEEQVQEHLLQLVLDALHATGWSASSLRTLMLLLLELMLEQREHVVDHRVQVDRAGVDLRRTRQVEQAVDDLGRPERLPLDLLEHLGARIVGARAFCSSIWVKLEMPVSGVFTSCATPAASRPIEAIFSRSAAAPRAGRGW